MSWHSEFLIWVVLFNLLHAFIFGVLLHRDAVQHDITHPRRWGYLAFLAFLGGGILLYMVMEIMWGGVVFLGILAIGYVWLTGRPLPQRP